MKVFINRRVEGWSGGLAIVAANSAEEAHRVYCFSDPITNYFDKDGNYCESKYAVTFSNYNYRREDWEEVSCLTADVAEPILIAEDGYTE